MKKLIQVTGMDYSDLPDLFGQCRNSEPGDELPELLHILDDNRRVDLLSDIYRHIHSVGVDLTNQATQTVAYMTQTVEDYEMSPGHVRLVQYVEAMGDEIDKYAKAVCNSGLWAKVHSQKSMEVASFWADANGVPVSDPEKRKIIAGDLRARVGRIVLVDAQDGSDPTPALCVTDNVLREGNRQEHLIPVVPLLEDAIYGQAAPISAARFLGHASKILKAFYVVANTLADQGMLIDPNDVFGLKNRKATVNRKPLSAEDNPDALIEIGSWS